MIDPGVARTMNLRIQRHRAKVAHESKDGVNCHLCGKARATTKAVVDVPDRHHATNTVVCDDCYENHDRVIR